jgi:Ca2+-binding RTX toxin-like protein
MVGGTGNHLYLEMPDGADVIQDAGGIDTIDFSSARSGISFNLSLDNGGTQGLDGRGNTLRVYGRLENVLGSMFHDNLSGNNADNFISGLAGDDKIGGASGRDLLIGGTGRDQIQGNSGEDLLIAGSTLHELNDRGLRAILAEWTSPLSLATRVAHLRGTMPGGLNQGYLLNSGTVSDDGVPDIMHGSNGPDWLFFNPDEGDLVPDLDPNEDVINDDPLPMRPVGGIPSQEIVLAERVFSRLAIRRPEGCSTDRQAGLGAEIGSDTLTRFTQKAV